MCGGVPPECQHIYHNTGLLRFINHRSIVQTSSGGWFCVIFLPPSKFSSTSEKIVRRNPSRIDYLNPVLILVHLFNQIDSRPVYVQLYGFITFSLKINKIVGVSSHFYGFSAHQQYKIHCCAASCGDHEQEHLLSRSSPDECTHCEHDR